MKEATRKHLNKIFVIGGIILSTALLILGIYFISHIKETGSEEVLTNESRAQSVIYTPTESLSDNDFEYGLEHIMPTTSIDTHKCDEVLSSISDKIEQVSGVVLDADYFCYFSDVHAYLKVFCDSELDTFLPLLTEATIFKQIYLLNSDISGNIHDIYVYSSGDFQKLFSFDDLSSNSMITSESSLDTMINNVCEEYSLESSRFAYSGDIVYINLSGVTISEVLCIFDYCWQYCYASENSPYLAVITDDTVLAFADTSPCELYDSYYPDNELAPLFRIKFYYNSFFVLDELRKSCEIYY